MKTKVFKKDSWLQSAGLLILLLLLALAAASCVSDNLYNDIAPTSKEKLVTFSLTLPGQLPNAGTRALTLTDEEEVKSIEVLLFTGGNYVETRTVAQAEIADISSGSVIKKSFKVAIPEGTYSSLVVLANSHSIVTAANLLTSDTKAAALAKLNVSNPAKWNATTGAYTAIPMWGEINTPLTVNQATSQTTNTTPLGINLTRMLAKVSVKLTAAAATTNFKLQTIQVYNYYNKGSVAPLAANFTTLATAASVPAGATKPTTATVTNPLTTLNYTGAEITTTNVASVGEIYLFEADSKAHTNLTDRTCLVIGGTYLGTTCYYRVDFVDVDGTTYLDVLRNHSYTFDVRKISGPGYSTPDKAFNARPYNIEATVVNWNDATIGNVGTDGQYMLGVSHMEYQLAKDAYTATDTDNQLKITTDYPGGWTIDPATITAPWLTVAPGDQTGTTGNKTIHLLVAANDAVGALPRTASLFVKAGNITLEVKINQSEVPNLGLSIKDYTGVTDIADLLFWAQTGTAPTQKQFIVSWAPKNVECSILSTTTGTVAFNYGTSDKPGTTGFFTTAGAGTGKQTYTIIPAAITPADTLAAHNPFLERMSKVDFTINNGTSYQSKSIILRQVNYALTTSKIPSSYMLDGKQYTIMVKSNTAWRIKSIASALSTGTGNLLALVAADNLLVGTIGGNNTTTGKAITFTVNNNVASLAGTVTVVFESTDSPQKFADVTVPLTFMGEFYPPRHTGWAGSNIYFNGANLTFDDVGVTTNKLYQGVFFQWGSLYGISPEGATYASGSTKLFPPEGGTSFNAVWTAIPRVDDVTSIVSHPATTVINPSTGAYYVERDRNYLYEITSVATGKGDICKYLTEKGWAPAGKKWRMPTSNEFEAASSYVKTGTFPGENPASSQAVKEGKYSLASYWTKEGAAFPAAGCRYNTHGAVGAVGSYGYYWAGSPYSTNGYYMTFFSGSVFPSNAGSRSYGFSVRCVAE